MDNTKLQELISFIDNQAECSCSDPAIAMKLLDVSDALHEFSKLKPVPPKPETNDWIDAWGGCKICGGEIPLGHVHDCAYWGLEQKYNASQSVLRDTVGSYRTLEAKLKHSLDNEADAIRKEADTVGELTKSLGVQREMVKLLEQRRVRIHELQEQLKLADDINDCLRSSQTNEEIEKLEHRLKLHKQTIKNSAEHADELSRIIMDRDDEVSNLERDLNDALTEIDQLTSQLPDGMERCTIIFKSCPVGHGRLTAKNWEDTGCKQCALVEAHAVLGKHVYNGE